MGERKEFISIELIWIWRHTAITCNPSQRPCEIAEAAAASEGAGERSEIRRFDN